MWGRAFWAISVTFASCTFVSAESIYLSASKRLENFALGDSYTFIAPYFTDVQTTLWISVTKAAGSTSSGNPSGSQNKPLLASVLFAEYKSDVKQIKYGVSCDLETIIKKESKISVTFTSENLWGGEKTVSMVYPDSVFVDAPTQPTSVAPTGGTINVSCPAAAGDMSATFGLTAIPSSRVYLYAYHLILATAPWRWAADLVLEKKSACHSHRSATPPSRNPPILPF
jgi:hypothetical protein